MTAFNMSLLIAFLTSSLTMCLMKNVWLRLFKSRLSIVLSVNL